MNINIKNTIKMKNGLFKLALATLVLCLPLSAFAQRSGGRYGGPQPLSFQKTSSKVSEGSVAAQITVQYPTGGSQVFERGFKQVVEGRLNEMCSFVNDAAEVDYTPFTCVSIKDLPQTAAQSFVDAGIAASRRLVAAMNEDAGGQQQFTIDDCPPLTLEFETKKLYANYFFASFENSGDIYLGGAHGTPIADIYSICRENGKLITIEDIFPANTHNKLKAIVFRNLKNKYAGEIEFWDDASTTLPGGLGVALMQDGVLFQYDAYEICAYACGTPSVKVPYSQLTSIMTKQAKRWIKN